MLLPLIIAIAAIILPGYFLSLALLRKTSLSMFEIAVIGVIFGLVFPPTLIWLESYLIPFLHFFTFTDVLYNVNVILLTLVGMGLCAYQGIITKESVTKFFTNSNTRTEFVSNYRDNISSLRRKIKQMGIDMSIIRIHEREEENLRKKQEDELSMIRPEDRDKIKEHHEKELKALMESHEQEERSLISGATHESESSWIKYVWVLLFALMVLAFVSRMMSIGIAPKFFEFDPYFDMQSTEYILVHGYQLLWDHSAWPTVVNGTIHRIQPIVPYLEAYWYELARNHAQIAANAIDTTLLSNVSAVYPPITAALLVFVIFMFLYHEYGEFPAIVGAALGTAMPALITTFIAGEQLLQPWGIFSLFFFYAAYLLAVNNPKEDRFSILAGIAFASTFLGAHYYTVNAGVLAIYIALQGIVHVLRNEDTKAFYRMNAIVLATIILFYALYSPYTATLTERIPAILGLPVIISFPLASLLFVFLLEKLPELLKEKQLIKTVNMWTYLQLLAGLAILGILLILFTPIGKPFHSYYQLSTHFTTPSIPLFMTVQEYAPTGLNFNFGNAGFGIIGASIGGVNLIVWLVLATFTLLSIVAIYYRNSKSAMLSIAAIWPLAVAGMIEVKYMPHFGVGYIIAIGIIIGELFILADNNFKFQKEKAHSKSQESTAFKRWVRNIALAIIVLEFFGPTTSLASAALSQNCTYLANHGNSLGWNMYCNTVPQYWIDAGKWMEQNIGPYGPRVLSWWDYGDWINWFGNTNAVLRGDNAVATSDYQTAAQYVLGAKDGFNSSTIAKYMDSIQAQYIVFDDQLILKWQALNFLACIATNQTSLAFARQQGATQNQPYLTGTSQCELDHSPAYIFVPVNPSSVNSYCQLKNLSLTAVKSFIVAGNKFLNDTVCVPSDLYSSNTAVPVYTSNGTRMNAYLIPNQMFYYGQVPVSGQTFADFMLVYAPNGPNDTITNAPTDFYYSNFYKAMFFGKLDGFSLAYPSNFTGMNFINTTQPIVILKLNNFTNNLPYVTPKPAWVNNNYTMPG